jgi:hypothetical protein
VFFLAVVLPGAFLAFALGSSFTRAALFWIALLVVLLALGSGLGLAIDALRGRLRRGPGGSRRDPAPIAAFASYAAGFTIAAGIESAWFLGACLETRTAETSRLEPVLAAGGQVTIFLSRYVRPVHGDIVLCRVPRSDGAMTGSPAALARVLAKPYDAIQARGGRLLVDGIELDLRRTDQQKALEKAGRAEKRRRLLPGYAAATATLAAGAQLDWSAGEWGPHILPGEAWLVILDPGDTAAGAPDPVLPAKAIVIGREHLLGRAIR